MQAWIVLAEKLVKKDWGRVGSLLLSSYIKDMKEAVEGNLKAVYYTGGGLNTPNMWTLYIRTTRGGWESIQWMSVDRIQELFQTKLPKF